MKRHWKSKWLLTIIVLVIMINLPIISALELSNVRAEDITDNSANVKWDTDEPADSFVSYGNDKTNLQKVGDAKQLTEHGFYLTGLNAEQEYFYKVESNDVVDDNSGSLYSFKTLAPDKTPPALQVDLPEMMAGTRMDVIGWTEPGAEVSLFLDGSLAGNTRAELENASNVITSNFTEEIIEEQPIEDVTIEEMVDEEVTINNSTEQIEQILEEINITSDPTSESTSESLTNETNINITENAITGQAFFGNNDNDKTAEKPQGKFTFNNILINKDDYTNITIESIDASGNKATFSGQVFSDNSKPKIEIGNYSNVIDTNSIDLAVIFSEEVEFEIFADNRSVKKGQGTSMNESISLQEGENKIKIIAKDVAGWETTKEIVVLSDTQPPTVKIEIEKGNEYYQGRAVSNIHGETEPGATLYLYVYRPQAYEFSPDFKRPWTRVTADQNGTFTFSDVNFEGEPISLEDFAPKQVPSGLEQYSIFPVELVNEQQRHTYYLFVIAEDQTGKTSSAQATITINSCYTGDWAFDVRSVPEFQRPMRLDPGLLDEGREQVTAVFNLSYRGSASPKINVLNPQDKEEAFQIVDVVFDRACTQSMMDDEQFRLGCSILPPSPNKIKNGDGTAWYLTYKLSSSQKLSEAKDDFWDEFQKRQLIFPMKLRIQYQERQPGGEFGPVKTQTSCYDLGYFVDIPIDSKDMIPDWLADEGMDAIEGTLNVIDTILPYLEKAILVTGYACIFSFLGRMTMRWIRIFVAKMEVYSSKMKKEGEKCPSNQNGYYLKSTIDHWKEIENIFGKTPGEDNQPKGDWKNQKPLDDLCPSTASMWKVEAALDQAYRWTCDRVYCRAVPAGWTASKTKDQVETVILAQNQCTVSSRGIPLQEVENCQELLTQDVTNPSQKAQALVKKGAFTCYRYNGRLYQVTSEQTQSDVGEVVTLEMIHDFGLTINQGSQFIGYSNLIAYKPPRSDQFIVGQDQSCKNACKNPRKPGYKPDLEGSITNLKSETATSPEHNGCYQEVYQDGSFSGATTLVGSKGPMTGNRFSAGYTKDCFVDFNKGSGLSTQTTTNESCSGTPDCVSGNSGQCINNKCVYQTTSDIDVIGPNSATGTTGLLQCVCTVDEKQEQKYGARTAAKEVEESDTSEDWVYRQSSIFKDTRGMYGTYYPEWRYYGGRDLSSAFGADYLLDYFGTEKTVHEVNPHTQFLGIYQTICLSGIRAHLVMLKSILEGLRGCIEQAKYTGLTDAGTCKTIFSQHVCGLIYKAIAYFFTSCSPHSFADETKTEGGVVEGIGEVFSAGFGSIGEAMQSSIDDIKSDYGNAKLNEYFSTGARGFTESLCMAAFGYDWPLGMDFILDSAYSYPMKSTVMVFPAERELATFNPTKGTAVYNYNLGAMVLPGCQIKSADVYLKCVGPEDQGHPGLQCGNQGCDCIHATESSSLEGEKIRYLDNGRQFNIKQGSFIDLKIPSPQKIDSQYRYDHVVVKLVLDSSESPDNCFDEGYKDGLFYFPIIDISPPAEFICQVQPTTGRYYCPEVVKMFGGGGGAYLEDPYISCYDKDSESYVSCKTPNLFVKGDQIKVKTHVVTDGEAYCLRMSATGLGPDKQELGIKQLPKNLPGPYGIETNLGTVSPELFSGAYNSMTLTSDSDPQCSRQVQYNNFPQGQIAQKSYTFTYTVTNSMYRVNLPAGVTMLSGYKNDGGVLTADDGSNRKEFSPIELQKINFVLDGFTVTGLIGGPSGQKNYCTYQSGQAAAQTYSQNEKPISVTAELLVPDINGDCYNNPVLVKTSGFGVPKHTENIILQMEKYVSQITNKMHQEFMAGNCKFVQDNAKGIINRKKNDMEDAMAIYYSAACHIIEAKSTWTSTKKNDICVLLDIFFNRNYAILGVKGEPYPDVGVKDQAEYQKINKYLSEIGSKLNCGISTAGTGGTPPPYVSPAGTTCAMPNPEFKVLSKPADWKPTNWANYVCMQSTGQVTGDENSPGTFNFDQACWSRGVYSTQEIATNLGLTFGCPGTMLCCPPPVITGTGATTITGTGTSAGNLCDKSQYPIDYLTGGNANWAFGCIDANTAKSCVKATGQVEKSSFPVAGTTLGSICAGT